MNRKVYASMRIFMVPALIFVLIFALMLCAARADDYEASTMRLLRYQGSVDIFDPAGAPRFVLENVRFASGEAMETGAESMASVSLDDEQIVTLDELSRVEFVQENGHILLNLSKGTLFLDVKEKLDENESLDIQTTTVTVGIRGTIVFVSQTETGTVFGVLEGTSQVSYGDSSGARRVIEVRAGQVLQAPNPEEGEAGVSPVVSEMTYADIEGFVHERVMEEEQLIDRVREGSEAGPSLLSGEDSAEGSGEDNLFPADGDWTWDGTVTLVAQSASKLFDGQPLSRPSDVLVQGLPVGLSIQVSANGIQTNAGTAANPIAHYSIFNAVGENVTSHFTHIETVSGVLRVEPIPLTIWTGSAEKYYDGEPLTCDEVELRSAPGYVYGDPEWRNTSLVTRTALGSETMISAVGCTWVHGVNPLTGDPCDIPLYTGQRLSVLIRNDGSGDSIEFQIDTLKPDELPEDILRLYEDNPELLAQACEDAGWDQEELAVLIAALEPAEADTVRRNGVRISGSAQDDLMRDSTDVRITIDTEITNYNSRPLNGDEAHFTPIAPEPTITVTATGSQTEVGESENTYVIDWGEALESNYVIMGEELGTLTVLPLQEDQVRLTAASVEKVYDGMPLENDTFTVDGLPEGFTVTATVTGSRTDAGTGVNHVESYQILDENGEDVTDTFSNVTVVPGTLMIFPATLTVTTGSAEKVYDGEPLVCDEAQLSGLVAWETATITANGSQLRAGSSDNTYAIAWGSAKESNYTVKSENLGTLTVDALAVNINCGGAEADYSGGVFVPSPTLTYQNGAHAGETVTGTRQSGRNHLYLAGPAGPLTRSGMDSITFLFALFTGDTAEVTISGLGTSVGTYTLTGSVSISSGSISDLGLSFSGTSLTICPKALTISTPSDSKLYDGTALTSGPAEITGLAEGDSVTVTVTGEITDIGTAENSFEIDWGSVDSANYTLTEEPGTLEITVNTTPITITAGSDEKVYDGTALTCETFEVSGLPEALTVEAVTDGSQTDADSSPNTITSYVIRNAAGSDVTACFSSITTADGTLTVEPLPVTFAIRDSVFTFDNGYHFVEVEIICEQEATGGFLGDSGYRLRLNGATLELAFSSIARMKDAGSYAISAEVASWNFGDPANYSVTVTDGSLTVEPCPITITTGSASKVFDGSPLTCSEGSATGMPAGVIYVIPNGTITDAGNVSNTYTIDWNGWVANNYTITENLGTLTVKPTNIYVFGHNDYSLDAGRAVVPGYNVQYYNEDDYSSIRYQSETFDPEVNPVVTAIPLSTGDTLTVSMPATGTQAGTYRITPSASVSGNAANYSLSVITCEIRLTARTLTITTDSASRTYNGSPLTAGVSVSGLRSEDVGKVTVSATGTIKDAGSVTNGYSIDWGGLNPDTYAITENLGTLTVNPLPVTISLANKSAIYSGKSTFIQPTVTSENSDFSISWATVGADEHVDIAWSWGDKLRFRTENWTELGSHSCSIKNIQSVGYTRLDNFTVTVAGSPSTLIINRLQLNVELDATSLNRFSGESPRRDPEFYVQYINGDHAGETLSPTSVVHTDDTYVITYDLYTGDRLVVTTGNWGITGSGVYNVTYSSSFTTGDANNYTISYLHTQYNIKR